MGGWNHLFGGRPARNRIVDTLMSPKNLGKRPQLERTHVHITASYPCWQAAATSWRERSFLVKVLKIFACNKMLPSWQFPLKSPTWPTSTARKKAAKILSTMDESIAPVMTSNPRCRSYEVCVCGRRLFVCATVHTGNVNNWQMFLWELLTVDVRKCATPQRKATTLLRLWKAMRVQWRAASEVVLSGIVFAWPRETHNETEIEQLVSAYELPSESEFPHWHQKTNWRLYTKIMKWEKEKTRVT